MLDFKKDRTENSGKQQIKCFVKIPKIDDLPAKFIERMSLHEIRVLWLSSSKTPWIQKLCSHRLEGRHVMPLFKRGNESKNGLETGYFSLTLALRKICKFGDEEEDV